MSLIFRMVSDRKSSALTGADCVCIWIIAATGQPHFRNRLDGCEPDAEKRHVLLKWPAELRPIDS
jgi:hypothetical protein